MGKLIFALLVAPLMVVLNGWVGALMWRWFVVPLGAPPIGTGWAIGLVCVVAVFVGTRDTEDQDDLVKAVIFIVLQPLFLLLVGFIARHFM